MDAMNNPLTSGTVLLRSVSLFLSNRQQNRQVKERVEKVPRKKKPKTLFKLDDSMNKKTLESLKRRTHFNK
jgi:hypothetical protein